MQRKEMQLSLNRQRQGTDKFLQPDIEAIAQADGSILLRNRQVLRAYKDRLGDYLRLWAGIAPQRCFLAERGPDGQWRRISYRQALRRTEQLAAGLLQLGLSAKRPLLLLSGNSIRFALLQLAALHIGLPVAPVSPAYSLQSRDFAKLKRIKALLQPGLVFVEDAKRFQPALQALDLQDTPVLCGAHSSAWPNALAFEELAQADEPQAVYKAYRRVKPATVAKILFTSGSTDTPKGVINTQRMLCSNQQALRQIWPFLRQRPPLIIDWLPWHHTFGGNHNFNLILRHGGTLYIDAGKPAPGMIEQTVANLRERSPTLYFNVPAGYDALTPYLEEDQSLAERFFKELDLLFCAAAALPQSLVQRLERLARAGRGEPIPLVTAWGATETAPLATATLSAPNPANYIGVPVPGTELKLTPVEDGPTAENAKEDSPVEDSYEIRVRGPNVTPGYWRFSEANLQAFDREKYYCTGDAARLLDRTDPAAGIVFDGRLTENFKLATGVWVKVGALRMGVLAACSPLLRDVVIAGQDRSEIGLLLWPSPDGCISLLGAKAGTMNLAELAKQHKLRARIGFLLRQYNINNTSSSTRIGRALFLRLPLSVDLGEMTDKGYINQRAVLRQRSDTIEKLYSDHPDVLVLPV